MNRMRMGLGTDQLDLPDILAAQDSGAALALLPTPRSGQSPAADPATLPGRTALAGLAPWARRMHLPGADC